MVFLFTFYFEWHILMHNIVVIKIRFIKKILFYEFIKYLILLLILVEKIEVNFAIKNKIKHLIV